MTLVDPGRRSGAALDQARDDDGRRTSSAHGRRWRAVAAVAVAVLMIGLVGTWFARHGSEPQQSSAAGPVLATREQLAQIAEASGHSLYWAGDLGRTTFETTVSGRDVYVRYLDEPSQVGTASRRLTVGTYERSDAYRLVTDLAAVPGATVRQLKAGALVVVPAGSTSAYFAFRGSGLLMEVYDPTPGRAFTLVTSGAVQPIATAATRP
jgi:hypothetical protein